MSGRFSADEIIEITGGRLAVGMLPDDSGAITTDTRMLEEGDWYLCLAGERFDGHNFLGDAFARGAIGAIVDERPSYPIANSQFPLIAVGSTLEAYHTLAKHWRLLIDPLVVAITGSSGKTTTKEMCAAIMSAGFKVHKSNANENNEIGVPRTILSMREDTQVLIIEMAMRGLGQISQLAATALPDIGIITNVGVAHLGPLAGLENITTAKCELLAHMQKESSLAIIGQPTEALLARAQQVYSGRLALFEPRCLSELAVTPEKTTFSLNFKLPQYASGNFKQDSCLSMPTEAASQIFEVSAHGIPHLQDAWCAIVAAKEAGLDNDTIARGLKDYQPVSGRGSRLKAENGALVIDETYNANPDSVRSAVSVFVDERVYSSKHKIVVLGELAELGDKGAELHRSLGLWLADKRLNTLITIGSLARHIAEGAEGALFEIVACQDQVEAERALRARLLPDSSVLIKGSHSANLDRLVARLLSESLMLEH